MDFQNLREHQEKLITYLHENSYSKRYIQAFRLEISRILKDVAGKKWASYKEIYLDLMKTPYSKSYLRNKKTIIGALEQFDLHGRCPVWRRGHSLFERGAYHSLSQEFRDLIDFFRETEARRGKKETTIKNEAHATASFLLSLQQKGADRLAKITEESVLSSFVSENGHSLKSYSYKNKIAAVFRAGVVWNEAECKRILSYLPAFRKTRKNIQYLTKEELNRVRTALDDFSNGLSLRDRVIVLLLMYTGLRRCDIVAMTLNAIDWETLLIRITQQKTEVPLELHFSALVGNAIYDYIQSERPQTAKPHLFLSQTHPQSELKSSSVWYIIEKTMKAAGIRQEPGARRGSHIFRHHLATSLLENGIPQPIISQVLGHTSPNSLEPYLRASFIHLKECALDISCFPVAEEVFGDD